MIDIEVIEEYLSRKLDVQNQELEEARKSLRVIGKAVREGKMDKMALVALRERRMLASAKQGLLHQIMNDIEDLQH